MDETRFGYRPGTGEREPGTGTGSDPLTGPTIPDGLKDFSHIEIPSAKEPGKLTIDGVIITAIKSIINNPLLYVALATLAALPGIVIKTTKLGGNMGELVENLVDLFFSIVFTSAITYGVYQDIIGKRASLIDAIVRGFSRYFPLVGISLVTIILFVCLALVAVIVIQASKLFGVIILAIAVIYCVCAYSVVVPACVVEGLGSIQSFTRSAELTKGNRLRIFGLFFCFVLISGIVSYITANVFPDPLFGVNYPGAAVQIVVNACTEVLIASLYYQLRVTKEGVGVDQLATVFD